MKKIIYFISIILIISLLFFKSYFNNNSYETRRICKNTKPTIKIEKYFDWPSESLGVTSR